MCKTTNLSCSTDYDYDSFSVLLARLQITSAGLWSHSGPIIEEIDAQNEENPTESEESTTLDKDGSPHLAANSWLSWISPDAMMVKSRLDKTDNNVLESQRDISISSERFKPASDDAIMKVSNDVPRSRFFVSPKESLRAAIFHIGRKWHGRLSFFLRLARRILGGLWVRYMMISFFISLFMNWFLMASKYLQISFN